MPRREAVVLFVRYPTPGKVKTRLAAGVGPQQAAVFYKHCAENVMRECSRFSEVACCVFASSQGELGQVRQWMTDLGIGMEVRPQVGSSNLGDRIHAAMHSCIQEGAHKVVIIGSDIPDITSSILKQAMDALDQYQVVLGPAVDGGYYLLGLSEAPTELFEGIQWSTPTVLAATVANAERLGLTVAPQATLPRLQDIDTIEDLQNWHRPLLSPSGFPAVEEPDPGSDTGKLQISSSSSTGTATAPSAEHPIATVVADILTNVAQGVVH